MAPNLRNFCIAAVAGIAGLIQLPANASPAGIRIDDWLSYRKNVVDSNTTHDYQVTFRGGKPARVEVSGDGSSDLDLYVFDQAGDRVCYDDDTTDDMSCSWLPDQTGDYTVRVRNRGSRNAYVLMHN